MEAHIEFYCSEEYFSKILEVPSVKESKGIYRLHPKREIQYATKYIIECPSKGRGQEIISSIRAWLRETHAIELMDPERVVLFGRGHIWAQLLNLPFDTEDYFEDYEIEAIITQ